MSRLVLIPLIGLSGGITIGSAAAAFFTLLKIVPRLAQITDTNSYIRPYQYAITLGATISSFIYFSEFNFGLNRYASIPVGILMGMFLGIFASALAEVLNVIPVFVKKFKAKHELKYIIAALIFGKLFAALYYWLVFVKN